MEVFNISDTLILFEKQDFEFKMCLPTSDTEFSDGPREVVDWIGVLLSKWPKESHFFTFYAAPSTRLLLH